MPKPPLSPMATRILEVMRQLCVDGRRYVVSRPDSKPTTIPANAPIVRFTVVSMSLLQAELIPLPMRDPNAALEPLRASIEGGLSELGAFRLVRPVECRPGRETPITYKRPDGKLVHQYYEHYRAKPAHHVAASTFLMVTAGNAGPWGYNIDCSHPMYELTSEGARIAAMPAREREIALVQGVIHGAPVVSKEELKLWIRQQIKAESKTSLRDDVLVAAYRQEGSMRKAADFLSKETEQEVSKDSVQRAVKRAGGVEALSRTEDSESIRRTVASQSRDRKKRFASPTQPPETE